MADVDRHHQQFTDRPTVGATRIGAALGRQVDAIRGDILRGERRRRKLERYRGRLRVAASIAFGAHSLAPTIVKFMKKYPQVSVELTLNDRMVDLVEEGTDVAMRVGAFADSSMTFCRF